MVIIKRILMTACICAAVVTAVHSQSTPPPTETPKRQPDSSSAKDHPQRVSRAGSVQMKDATKRVAPQYPVYARQDRIQGTVRLYTLIGTDGRVIETKYISGPMPLVQAAIAAVKQWEFRPYLVNGTPVEVETAFDLTFGLSG